MSIFKNNVFGSTTLVGLQQISTQLHPISNFSRIPFSFPQSNFRCIQSLFNPNRYGISYAASHPNTQSHPIINTVGSTSVSLSLEKVSLRPRFSMNSSSLAMSFTQNNQSMKGQDSTDSTLRNIVCSSSVAEPVRFYRLWVFFFLAGACSGSSSYEKYTFKFKVLTITNFFFTTAHLPYLLTRKNSFFLSNSYLISI